MEHFIQFLMDLVLDNLVEVTRAVVKVVSWLCTFLFDRLPPIWRIAAIRQLLRKTAAKKRPFDPEGWISEQIAAVCDRPCREQIAYYIELLVFDPTYDDVIPELAGNHFPTNGLKEEHKTLLPLMREKAGLSICEVLSVTHMTYARYDNATRHGYFTPTLGQDRKLLLSLYNEYLHAEGYLPVSDSKAFHPWDDPMTFPPNGVEVQSC